MADEPQTPRTIGDGPLSIALIGPDEKRRAAVAQALAGSLCGSIREFAAYPTDLDELPSMLSQQCDVAMVDLDGNPEYALEVVESIYASSSATVIVYSTQANLDLAVRSMRAGAREFLTLPIAPATLADALARISFRGSNTHARRTARRLFVFLGSKGGCGVTTIASNFAVVLAQDSGQSTLLIDLGLPLGDAALNLGMITEFSTVNAQLNSNRLDASFLSSLLAHHSSGLSVLGAPREFPKVQPPLDTIDTLVNVARQNFDYVVVDVGSRIDLWDTALFDESANLYLITQPGISELRNAHRLISQVFASRGAKLQLVLNRYAPHALGVDDSQIAKALTQPVHSWWKIPDDLVTARRTRDTSTPLAMEDSPISRAIRKMARKACGLPEEEEKKHRFKLGWMQGAAKR